MYMYVRFKNNVRTLELRCRYKEKTNAFLTSQSLNIKLCCSRQEQLSVKLNFHAARKTITGDVDMSSVFQSLPARRDKVPR